MNHLLIHQALPPEFEYFSGRGDYLDRTGGPAPAFRGKPNPADPNDIADARDVLGGKIKRWRLRSPASGPLTMHILVKDSGSVSVKQVIISEAEANAPVNLPGQYAYPSYDAWLAKRGAPKAKYAYSSIGQTFLYDPLPQSWPSFITQAEAEDLAREMSLDIGIPVTVFDGPDGSPLEYYPGEDRRTLDLKIGDLTTTAGYKLRERSANGMGAPGRWVRNTGGIPSWLAEPQDIGATAQEVPVPFHMALLDFYTPEISQGLMDGGQIILRPKSAAVPGAGGGGFTEADRSILMRIAQDVDLIKGRS